MSAECAPSGRVYNEAYLTRKGKRAGVSVMFGQSFIGVGGVITKQYCCEIEQLFDLNNRLRVVSSLRIVKKRLTAGY